MSLPIEAELVKRFGYHKPSSDVIAKHCEAIRTNHLSLAKTIVVLCPQSRELELALVKLEESMQHCIAAIVRNQG